GETVHPPRLDAADDPIGEQAAAGQRGRPDDPQWDRDDLEVKADERARILIGAVEDAEDRQRVEDRLIDPAVFIERRTVLAAIGARDPPALPSVLEPLPIQINRHDGPQTNRPCDRDGGGGDEWQKPKHEKARGFEAFLVEAESRVGGDHMVVAEEPEIEDQD